MENSEENVDKCPSFSSYSSNRLAEIATKVAAEDSNGGDDGDDFEFVLVREDQKEVLTDEFSYDGGQMGPVFPVFNRDPSRNDYGGLGGNKRLEPSITVPLRNLLIMEDRELHNCEIDNPNPSCSSSDDTNELESVSSGALSYGVWQPKAADQPSPSRCKKSNSTGSVLERLKLCDFLRRSNSEGKDGFVLLTPKLRREERSSSIEAKRTNAAAGASAHEVLYIRNRATKEEGKKKSYLPYRRDLVGLFVNAKSFTHF